MRSEEIKKGRVVEVEADDTSENEGPDWPRVIGYGIAAAVCFLGAKMIGSLIDASDRDRG